MPPKSKKEAKAKDQAKGKVKDNPKGNPKDKSKEPNSQKPDWPPLRPLIPSSDLLLTPLLADQIYLIRNFFTASLCKNYVSFLSSLPLVTTPGRPKKGDAVRVNDRFQIDDPSFADSLWAILKHGILSNDSEADTRLWGGKPLGLNPNIRVYRYSPGQFFAQHYDDSNTLTLHGEACRTTWTLLIYLSTCTGGETVFYPDPSRENRRPDPVVVVPEMGLALLHRHGERCLLHEGGEVREGEKWVLRSDLVVAR
ncbi:hypothetical protein ASPZODRAFT_56763 [Penicilliopsis zonata CBS 506.65]|uniref:Fe2OG dioxygenase domain-containing protein n=1 Tax=Penicilliopsis zonata CBS 506.65 TaxID=1073090 RepID=A0A1L9SWA2_9EURO|nr:hypothetical protein ASPZODRAFT_56763 [Penicilliopsis zonata CBS 506.65]OJJ51456.1 hypothetical protein ASPZODRAFT_56763 [Penicilliopsis zonata CBS 506.65]